MKKQILGLFLSLLIGVVRLQAMTEADPYLTKGIDVDLQESVSIEEFITVIERKDGGLGVKLNVLISPEAKGTMIPPVTVRNVSAMMLFNIVSDYAGLNVHYTNPNEKSLSGILNIRKNPSTTRQRIIVPKRTNSTVVGGNPQPAPPANSPLQNKTDKKEARPYSVTIEKSKNQLRVIPLGKLNPRRWSMHKRYLTEHIRKAVGDKESKELEGSLGFYERGQLLILRLPEKDLEVAESLVNAYLASMADLEHKADGVIKALKSELHKIEAELGTAELEGNHPEIEMLRRKMILLEDKIAEIEAAHGLR